MFGASGGRKKTNRTTTENEMEGEDRGDKGNRIMNSRVLALSCLTCWLFCTMPFSRVVLLKRGLNWRQKNRKTILETRCCVTPLFDFCCFVVLLETVHQFWSQQQRQFFFSLSLHIPHTYTYTHTHAHIHTRKMHNFSEYFPHLSSHILFHTEIAAHV